MAQAEEWFDTAGREGVWVEKRVTTVSVVLGEHPAQRRARDAAHAQDAG